MSFFNADHLQDKIEDQQREIQARGRHSESSSIKIKELTSALAAERDRADKLVSENGHLNSLLLERQDRSEAAEERARECREAADQAILAARKQADMNLLLTAQLKEAEQALSDRTVSCGNCAGVVAKARLMVVEAAKSGKCRNDSDGVMSAALAALDEAERKS